MSPRSVRSERTTEGALIERSVRGLLIEDDPRDAERVHETCRESGSFASASAVSPETQQE